MEQRLLLVLESIRDELRGIREVIEPREQEENQVNFITVSFSQ